MSIGNTPQAKDDVFAGVENKTVTFDVMANDLGGNGKSLYSIDQSNPLHVMTSATSRLGAAITMVDGKVVYNSTGAAALEKLSAGQTVTDTFQYVIQMGNGTLSVANVTVTVTGTNDGPLLSADPVASHALTEVAGATGSATLDNATATLAFTDVDLNDTHTVTIGAPVATWSAGTVPAATVTALNTALTSAVNDSTGTGAGSVGLTFAAADKAFDFLAQGQTLTVTYNVTLSDGQGGAVTRPVTFVVTGTNDAPVLAADSGAHALTETAGAAGSTTAQTASATLAFTDVDLTDTHTASVGAPAIVWSAGQPLPAGLSAALTGALTATVADSTNTGAGSVTASFSAADKTFDFLGAGQTLTVTYNVSVNDGRGGVSTQPVSIVVTGSNDGPVLAADSGPHGIAEATLVTGSTAVDSASATLVFTDLDLTDTHTVSVAAPSVVWSGGATLPAGLAATLASGLSTAVTEANGAGSLTVTLAAPDKTFDFLSAGEKLSVTYDVTLSDGHGGTATRPVTFVVTGANDAVVIDPDASGPHVLTEQANTTNSLFIQHSSASLTGTDPDLNDTHEVTFGPPTIVWSGGVVPPGVAAQLALAISEGDGVDSTGTGHGTALPNFDIQDKFLDFLAEGETLTVTYDVRVDDGHGSIGVQPVTFTILGTNDKPVLLADTSGPHAIAEAAGVTGSAALDSASATLQFFGIDAKDVHTVSSTTQSVVWSGGSTLPAGLAATLGASLQTSLSQPSGPGTLTATLTAPDKTFDFLAQGETLTVTYAVTIDDGHGGTATRPVTFVVTGANDAVVISPDAGGPHVLNELPGVVGSAFVLKSTATLEGVDPDLSDEHDVNISAPTVVWSAGAPPPAVVAALANALTEDDPNGPENHTGSGQVGLTFAAADKTFDFLNSGETLTVTYQVNVVDRHGGTSTQPVTFTIVGANDRPVLMPDASGPHALAEQAGVTDSTSLDSASATLNFFGIDATDQHSVSSTTQSIVWSGGSTLPSGLAATLASSLQTSLSQPSGPGTLTATLAAPDKTFDFLSEGETLTVTYNVTMDDGHGGTATRPVTFVVTGANDAEVLNPDVSGPHVLNELANTTGSGLLRTVTATITGREVDINDDDDLTAGTPTLTWSGGSLIPGGPLTTQLAGAIDVEGHERDANGNGSATLTLTMPDKAFDFLSAGETLTVTYPMTLDDHHGSTVSQPVTFTIVGANDAPNMNGQASLERVVNGGFEQNNPALPGFAWTNASGAGLEILSAGTYGVSGASGLVMEVDVNGGAPLDDVSQTIATVAGKTYNFGFDAAARSSFPGATNAFQVLWNGVVIDTVTPGSTAMAHHGYTVTATGSTSTIEFRELASDGVGGIIDNVSVKDAIAERAGVTGSAAADTTSVTFTLVDLDLNDTHTVTRALTNVAWTGGPTLPAGLSTVLAGALTTSMTDTTGQATGSVTATFSAPDATFDFLAQGESLTVFYSVTATDSQGASVTRPMSVVITGTNDAPQVAAVAPTAVAVGAVSTVDALANASDVDHGAQLSVVNVGALPAGVTYNAATHSFSLNTANAAYAGLPSDQSQTVTVSYGVSDGLATTAASTSWKITGANHNPVLAAAPTTSGAISFYAAEGNVVDTIGTANGTAFGVTYATGHDGQAFTFNGSNYATIPNQIPANFTIEGWFKTSANSLTGGQFFQGNGLVYADVGGLAKDFGISILNNHLAFGTGGVQDLTIQSTSNVVTGDWVNFAAVRNGSVISLYVNGNLEASTDTGYAGLLNAPSVINLGANTIDSRYFTGQLDGLSVYNRALSTAELQGLAAERGTTLVEPSNVTGSSAALGTTIALKLSDVDTSDSHSATISAPTLTWSGGALPAGVASALAGAATATVSAETAGDGDGAVSVSFSAPQSTFDFLTGGQTLTATYTVSVSDGHGGAASQPVTFTIVGTNDLASISGTSTGAVQEDGVLTASGVLSVADADSGQAHFLAPASLSGTYGAFTFNDGAWGYTLNNGAANVQALAPGQVVHDLLTVTSQDGTASKTIDVAITGQDPVFTQLLANNSFEGGSISSTQIPGWTNNGGTFLEIVGNGFTGIGGSDGHMIDTQGTPGGITISQFVDVPTGDHATLTIRVAKELLSDGRHPGSSLVFTWDGAVVKTITEADFGAYNQLQTFTVDVVGQAGQDQLKIQDTGTQNVGYALDYVKLEAWIIT